jgi:hypothetical protein
MYDETLERIDAAIAALQNVEPHKAALAEPIIARRTAARRGLQESRALYALTVSALGGATAARAGERGVSDDAQVMGAIP